MGSSTAATNACQHCFCRQDTAGRLACCRCNSSAVVAQPVIASDQVAPTDGQLKHRYVVKLSDGGFIVSMTPLATDAGGKVQLVVGLHYDANVYPVGVFVVTATRELAIADVTDWVSPGDWPALAKEAVH